MLARSLAVLLFLTVFLLFPPTAAAPILFVTPPCDTSPTPPSGTPQGPKSNETAHLVRTTSDDDNINTVLAEAPVIPIAFPNSTFTQRTVENYNPNKEDYKMYGMLVLFGWSCAGVYVWMDYMGWCKAVRLEPAKYYE